MAVSNEEILAFLTRNPNMSDADIVASMQMYGVSPQQVIQATGMSPSEGLRRYNEAMSTLGIPQAGLQGSEQAMDKGLESALNALVEQQKIAQQQYQTGLASAQAQYDIGRDDVGRSTAEGASQISSAIGAGQAALRPYQQMGEELINPLMGLSGARGQEAFDAAVVESPYMRYLQEQGERAVTRNAAALGGLGGGNVMLELQRQGQGLASQGLQQQYGNMAGLFGQGYNAAQGSANLSGQAAGALGGLYQNQGSNLANLASNAAGTQFAGNQAMANSTQQFGQNVAEGMFSTGQTIGQNRMNVGMQLANNEQATRMQLANLAAGQGQQTADIYGVQSGNLANLLSGAGLAGADIQRIIAMAQAQTAQNQSGQQAGLPGIPGIQEHSGLINRGEGQGGQVAAAALLALSDYRLKENIQPIGSENGVNLYSWDWKADYLHLTQGMPTTGVIAQEIMLTHPDAVFAHPSGFYAVDYSKVM